MKPMRRNKLFALSLAGVFIAAAGCSGGTSSSSINTGGGGSGSSGTNIQSISSTPPGGPGSYVDGVFTSVTVCSPGSTTNCQTIDGVLLDTGSSGLRILSSALSVSLSQQTGANGDPVVECLPFVDGVTWGPVQTADITINGEQAKSLPIQVIGSSNFSTVSNGCLNYGAPEDTFADLGANGILGVGNFPQDCGGGCTESGANNPGLYYTCSGANCEVTTESIANQVANPVIFFPTDNNGVLIDLSSVSGAQANVTGSVIFGIGTQSNNALGSATVYTVDPNYGNFTTTFNNVTYGDNAYLDSGSNALYFDSNTMNIPVCNDLTFWYCPSSTLNLSATNQGFNGATGTVSFVVGNADTLTANDSDYAVNGLAGPNPGMFDWGLPFFFGRKVFTAIEGQNTPAGAGPYVAY